MQTPKQTNEWDYIIIGAGTAGCVLANRLASNKKLKILLIEAGYQDKSLKIKIPALQPLVFGNKKFDWCYRANPDATRDNISHIWPAGKVWGGSSSLNGMIYIRGQKEDFDEWMTFGIKGWDYNEVLKYFRKSENNERGASTYHGSEGPVYISDMKAHHLLNDEFIKASIKNNISFNNDFNGENQFGVGKLQVFQKHGFRQNTSIAYLNSVKTFSNLKIVSGAIVEKVIIENGKALGVQLVKEGIVRKFFSKGEVIVSAGTIGSPMILQRSGIGNGQKLKELGISVKSNQKAVGKNLQEHPGSYCEFPVNISTYNTQLNILDSIKHIYSWIVKKSGPIVTPAATCCAFFNTKGILERPDAQIHFSPFSYHYSPLEKLTLPKYPAVLTGTCLLNPEARGEVMIPSKSPLESPIIFHELWGSNSDLLRMKKALKKVSDIFSSEPISKYVKRNPLKNLSDDELSFYIKNNSFMGYHSVGTCAMGDKGVLNSDLTVKKISKLRVVDASIIPKIIRGNTNATVIMIAEKAADLIKKSHP